MTTESTTVPRMFVSRVAKDPDKAAIRFKQLGVWSEVTWAGYLEHVRRVALGLTAMGVAAGDTVAVMGKNRPEWLYSDIAIMLIGGATVGIHVGSPPNQCQYILSHSGARVFIVEDDQEFQKVLALRDSLPNLQTIVVMEPGERKEFGGQKAMTFGELEQQGQILGEKEPDLFDKLVKKSRPEDPALILYVPGTAGPPKGAILSHGNITWTTWSIGQAVALHGTDDLVSSLPLSHIAERMFSVFLPIRFGYTVSFSERPDTLLANFCEISPSVVFAVPRMWESFRAVAQSRFPDAPKQNLGLERCRVAFSGAAGISRDVVEYFQGIGISLRQVYGQTECSGPACLHRDEAIEIGNVGPGLPGVKVRIAEDGEVLIKGPNVFPGYYRDPEATREVLKEGWLCSGDVGELDERGFLAVTDRKKDLLIKAGGKNISPQNIENKIRSSPYVSDVIVVGEGQKFISALIVLDEKKVEQYAFENKIMLTSGESLSEASGIRELIQREIEQVNRTLDKAELVKKFVIVSGMLYDHEDQATRTIKAKRKYVNEKFADVIEAMYKR